MGKASLKPFKVGIVGAGQISEFHIRGIKRFTHATVVGTAEDDVHSNAAT